MSISLTIETQNVWLLHVKHKIFKIPTHTPILPDLSWKFLQGMHGVTAPLSSNSLELKELSPLKFSFIHYGVSLVQFRVKKIFHAHVIYNTSLFLKLNKI